MSGTPLGNEDRSAAILTPTLHVQKKTLDV